MEYYRSLANEIPALAPDKLAKAAANRSGGAAARASHFAGARGGVSQAIGRAAPSSSGSLDRGEPAERRPSSFLEIDIG